MPNIQTSRGKNISSNFVSRDQEIGGQPGNVGYLADASRRERAVRDGDRLCAMSDSDAELLKLPTEEKLRLLELLWESLSASASALPLSHAHRAAIDEALDEHRQAPDDVLTMEQVLSGVRRAR